MISLNRFLYTLLVLLLMTGESIHARAQTDEIDSIRRLLDKSNTDTEKVILMAKLATRFGQRHSIDTALSLTDEAENLAVKVKFPRGQVFALSARAGIYTSNLASEAKGLEIYLSALQLAQEYHLERQTGNMCETIGGIYIGSNDFQRAIQYFLKGAAIFRETNKESRLTDLLIDLAAAYNQTQHPDSAIRYSIEAYNLAVSLNSATQQMTALNTLAHAYSSLNRDSLAMVTYRKIISMEKSLADEGELGTAGLGIARLFLQRGENDSAEYYGRIAFRMSQEEARDNHYLYIVPLTHATTFLVDLYQKLGKKDSALYYAIIDTRAKDSLINRKNKNQLESFGFGEVLQQQALENQRKRIEDRNRLLVTLGLVAVLAIIGVILWWNNKQRHKANNQLSQQKAELEEAFIKLKSTQAQLIQAEKMASLGEMTAGIAHEIQNPLNFVNNFSDVNVELTVELDEQVKQGNLGEVIALSGDIRSNQEKISHHGRRAESIVKGMLEHSRTNMGDRQATDLNQICDEYLRLSYQSLRAKDKTFAAGFTSDFDPAVGKVNLIRQDFGRVLLNLFNNAFYATREKKKDNPDEYAPQVKVTTRRLNDAVEIIVSDNGAGVPAAIREKIFQPFFTTKPSGEGTGLGLSLSYDIVVKGHKGTITVNSEPETGTSFTIRIPA